VAKNLLGVFLNYKIVLKTLPCLTVAAQKKRRKGKKGPKSCTVGCLIILASNKFYLSFSMHTVVTLHHFCTAKESCASKNKACIASLSIGLYMSEAFFASWNTKFCVATKQKMLQTRGKAYRNACYAG